MDRTDIQERDLMRMRRMAGLLVSDPAPPAKAWNPGDNDQTPLVAARCQGFGNAAEILELG